MATLDAEQSRALLVKTVNRLYSERHAPVSGALVKATMIDEAAASEDVLNEREIGFKTFSEFVRSEPSIAVQTRTGSDMLLAPANAGQLLSAYAGPLPRLRRDFWRAFIEFPIDGTVRIYDPVEDKVVYEDASTQRSGILIEPVPREAQLRWRQTFAEEQSGNVKEPLLAALSSKGAAAFNDFARRLRESPPLLHAWNRYLQKQVSDYVEAWASKNGVSDQVWRGGRTEFSIAVAGAPTATAKPQTISQRAQLYNFFDSLPIEDLLQLRVPLEWVLKVTSDKK